MEKVQAAFDELAAMILDPSHSHIQYQEMRRSFFAGVMWGINELERTSRFTDDPHGEKCYAYMQSLQQECVRFGQLVQEGKR